MSKLLAIILATGIASQYGPGVMPRVIQTRQRLGDLPQNISGYDGYIAVANCRYIGHTAYILPHGGELERFLVADCASKSDQQGPGDDRSGYEWMTSEGIVAEVDYETARRWNTVGRGIRVTMILKQHRTDVLREKPGGDHESLLRGPLPTSR